MPFAETKSLFASKTFWVNLITTIIAVLALVGGQEWIADYPKATAAIGAALGLLNIVLRVITVDAVKIFAVVMAVGLALSASPAHARPIRQCDGTACKVTAEPTLNLSPAQARWFRAMPLPWIERNVIRAMLGR
jgi:hypothetical protein